MAYVTTALGGSYHYLNIEEGADLLGAQAALNAIDTTLGRGATVVITAQSLILTGTLKVPDRIVLAGSGIRGTFVNGTGPGAMFEFDGAEYSGLHDMRLGMGSAPSLVGIDLKTSVKSCRKLDFRNLEIAGGKISGQIGIRSITSSSNIISECSFSHILFVEVDQPVLEVGRKVISGPRSPSTSSRAAAPPARPSIRFRMPAFMQPAWPAQSPQDPLPTDKEEAGISPILPRISAREVRR